MSLRCLRGWLAGALILAGLGCNGTAPSQSESKAPPAEPKALPRRSVSQQMGAVLTTVPTDLTPRIERLSLPDLPSAHAIWGASGRDDWGNLYFGIAVHKAESAFLLQYDPTQDTFTNRGEVAAELRKAGLYRNGEAQMKIHSKFLQADDGFLYFASMDESGEKEDGSVYPTWGGHLWRMDLQTHQWEHLLATKEALIAVTGNGRWVYALGYFNHVVYQYDTQSNTTRSFAAGSVGGHISRNFMADSRGHVYVPSIKESGAEGDGQERLEAFLLELDEQLKPVQRTLLKYYPVSRDFDSHGIVAFTYLWDGSCVFSTSTGYLYQIAPPANDGPATVTPLGWFHPEGEAYATSLFTFSGKRYLVGQARRTKRPTDWITYDLAERKGAVVVDVPGKEHFAADRLLIYGTHTRDNAGNCYLVGRAQADHGKTPIILKVSFGEQAP